VRNPPPRASVRTQSVYYREAGGDEPVDIFIERLLLLAPLAAAKIDDAVENYLNDQLLIADPPEFPITSQVDGELRELRVRFAKTRYRILYQRSGPLCVLLHALEKATGPLPKADINVAKRRFADFKARMNARPRRPPRAAGRDAPPKHRR
jgi:phage-related protein